MNPQSLSHRAGVLVGQEAAQPWLSRVCIASGDMQLVDGAQLQPQLVTSMSGMVITSRLLSGLSGFSSSSFGPVTSSSSGDRWFGEQHEESTTVLPDRPSF